MSFSKTVERKGKFRLQSNYLPPLSAKNCLEDYIYTLKIEATKLKPRKTRNNLSQRRQIALKKLRKRKDIIIKKADKGSTVVIQDKQEYIETGLEHLSDKDTYNELQEDQTKQVAEEVTQAVRAMYQEGHIDKPTAEYLLSPQMVMTQEMYFQKKTHKNPPSVRPIVSGCNGPTEKISAYLDHWLQPLAKSLPSYIKDTKEFVKYIKSTKLPKDCILCTLDVSSLYTNIPTEDGIHAALQAIENWKNKDPTCPPTSWLKKLLELILYKNVFRFNDKFYIQKQGTAMGTKMAPAYANIFMGTLESRILSQTNPSPIHWKRYIDDIFLVWTNTKESLEQFIKSINDLHPRINFTAEFSTDEIIFLDLCPYKGERFAKEGILDIKTHIKPTNTQQYVHASSAHPPGTGRGIIKGELLRYLRTNSNEATFQTYKEKHVQNMKKRGYRQEVIDKSIKGINFSDRQRTLADKPHNAGERLTFTTTYSPHLPTYRLRRLLVKHWHLIEKSPLLSRLFPNRPTIAFRTYKNIRKQLTRARLEDSKIVYKINRDLNLLCEPLPAPNAPPLIKTCNNNCLTCKALDTKPYIRSTSKSTYHNLKIKNTISCKSRNVLYVITCTRCKVQYVGMTTQPLHNRFSTHMREMFSKRPPNWVQTHLYRHFQQKYHNPSDVLVQPVEYVEDRRNLKKRESAWIKALRTIEPCGLNIIP